MKNSLISIADKIRYLKKALIETFTNGLKNILQIGYSIF